MNEKRIEIGDRVQVFFSTAPTVIGVVEYIPNGTGDSWIILDDQAGRVNYVQSFNNIILKEKGSGSLPF